MWVGEAGPGDVRLGLVEHRVGVDLLHQCLLLAIVRDASVQHVVEDFSDLRVEFEVAGARR